MNLKLYEVFANIKIVKKTERRNIIEQMTKGRPKKEIKREYPITIWLTEEELETVNKFCEEWGYNRGSVGRTAIMKYIRDWREIK